MNILKLFKKREYGIPKATRTIPMPLVKPPKKQSQDYILELENQVSILTERIVNLEEEMTKINPDFHRKDKGIFQEIAELMEERN
jgi:ribosomal protein S15P/S13E